MADVVLDGVSKEYPGGIRAVDNLDVEVRDRELLVVVGPSGCGKSTVLRMIAGLEDPTGGTIRIGPRVVNRVSPRDRNVAMMFQDGALYPHMTVRGNMAFGLRLRHGGSWFGRMWGRSTSARRLDARRRCDRRVRRTARMLGIEGLLDRRPRELSGGQRQRAALGRAIVRTPEVFLLDEPLSGLDSQLRADMRRELKRLHGRLDTTVVYVTHDQAEAMALGERIAVMREGALQQIGTPMDIYDRPVNRFVGGFVGSPPMNLIEGSFVGDDGKVRFVDGGAGITFTGSGARRFAKFVGRQVVLGVRPEDVLFVAPEESADARAAGVVVESECLGDSTVVRLRMEETVAGGTATVLQSKVSGRCSRCAGESVRLAFRCGRMHVFECQSGRNLSLESE